MPRRPGEALLCSWVEGLLLLSSRGSCAWTMMEREALAALSPAECSMRQARGGCSPPQGMSRSSFQRQLENRGLV